MDISGWFYDIIRIRRSYQDGGVFNNYITFVEKTNYRIELIRFYFKSRAWYVKGFCLSIQDIRLFIERLLKINL